MAWAGAGVVGVEVAVELEGVCLVGMSSSIPPWDLIAADLQADQSSRPCLALLAFRAAISFSVSWSTPLDTMEEAAFALLLGVDFPLTPCDAY